MKKYLIILALVLLCFVLLTSKVNATTQDYAITTINTSYQSNLNFVVPDWVYSKYLQLYNDYGSSYYIMIYKASVNQSPVWRYHLINKASNPNFYFIYYFGTDTMTGAYGSIAGSTSYTNSYWGQYDEITHTWSYQNSTSLAQRQLYFGGDAGSYGVYSYPHVIPLYSNYDSFKIVYLRC